SRLIFCHKTGVFASHHGEHGDHRDHCRQQAGCPHSPVKNKHQHQHRQKQHHSTYDIRQVMGQESLCICCRCIQSAPDQTGSIGVKKSQGSFHHMGHPLLPDVFRSAESRQMGTHQSCKIQNNTSHRKSERHPSVPGNTLGLCPFRRH